MTKNSAFHFWTRFALAFGFVVAGPGSLRAQNQETPPARGSLSTRHLISLSELEGIHDLERVRSMKGRMTDLARALRHGDIAMETYAHELKTMMGEALAFEFRKLAGDVVDGFMEYYRALAWNYGLLHPRFRDTHLEMTFVRGYADRVQALVAQTNVFADLFIDNVARLGDNEDFWLSEEMRDTWRAGAPLGWFGSQWSYVSVHITPEGQRLLAQASALSTATNNAFFRVREALPYPDEDPGAPDFWFWMVDQARVQALVHFDDMAEVYLKGRQGFLGLESLIQKYRRDACALTLAKLLP